MSISSYFSLSNWKSSNDEIMPSLISSNWYVYNLLLIIIIDLYVNY